MDHAEALERIEIAAVEPRGLERLTAGDTPDAAAVAGHLAGCPACAAELARIRRSSATVREVVLAEPDPALRERTLAYVRALGRERGRSGDGAPVASAADGSPALATLRRPRRRFAWAAGLAAALVVAGALGFAAGGTWLAGQGNRDREVALLQDATASAMRIAGQPDARAVTLAATTAGAGGGGRLVFSASSGELVMTATGLAPLEAGAEYGCWVEVDGERRRLGRMYWAGNLWAWAGPADGLADLPAGTAFGVSLVAAGGGDGQPVLAGEL